MTDRPPHDRPSRRQFLVTAGAALGLGPLVAACGGGGGDVVAAECPGYDALTAQDLNARQALNYVDETPIPVQRCDNCQFYQADAYEAGSPCGGCTLFAGPVVAGGYCTGWVATQTA
jgi:hypothetical protein